jgi:L-threonylcarbamoyladenylate synthase
MAEIITLSQEFREQAFSRCREVIRAGGIVAYPTDTFYGLGVNPCDAGAVRRLFEVKGRSEGQPILLLIPDDSAVSAWAAEVSASAHRLMQRFWPGPLTLVFTARPDVLPQLTGGTGRIGLRVPGDERTRSLLRFLGCCLTGTSANRSGGRNPRTAAEVSRDIGDRVDLILDGGPSEAAAPSTVVDTSTEPPQLIRRGAVDVADLFAQRSSPDADSRGTA